MLFMQHWGKQCHCRLYCKPLLDELETALLVGFEGIVGRRHVALHQKAVPGDIGAEDGGVLGVKAFRLHAVTSQERKFGD